jgi:hypothetical protein
MRGVLPAIPVYAFVKCLLGTVATYHTMTLQQDKLQTPRDRRRSSPESKAVLQVVNERHAAVVGEVCNYSLPSLDHVSTNLHPCVKYSFTGARK